MEQNKLISLAMNFSSFIIHRIKIDSIILFGSVAKNNFDLESDIDIFIETDEKNKEKILNLLELYKKSQDYQKFYLEGIKNEISLKIGKLDSWKDLKRSIISGGIVLYGNFKGKPDDLKHKILFILNIENKNRADKLKIWRKIYGYKQNIGKKIYNFNGFSEKKIGRGAFIIPFEKFNEINNYLIKNKIKHSFIEIWVE